MGWESASTRKSWLKSQQRWQPKWKNKSSLVNVIAKDYALDKEARHTGTVLDYYKWSGYGFIKPDEDGVVPGDKLYVHFSNIQTNDRYPFLLKGMKVEFGLMKWTAEGVTSLHAKTVTEPGGGLVAVQDDVDAVKTFVGGQEARFQGMLKFYIPKQGYGYAQLDDTSLVDDDVPRELRVEEAEVNGGGKRPRKWMENMPVEFGIWKNKAGQYRVYNMTLPGGNPITMEHMEHRQTINFKRFRGKLGFWNSWNGFGFVEPESSAAIPPAVQQKIRETQQGAKQKGKEPEVLLYFRKDDLSKGIRPYKGMQVEFKLYTDDKGVGATDITEIDNGKLDTQHT